MSITFTIEAPDAATVALKLERLALRASDIRPVAGPVRALVLDANRRTFEQSGPGWRPLSPSTVAAKQARGQSSRIMRATGLLERSLTSASGPDQTDERQPTQLRFGTSVPYARFHQYGTRKMPARPVLRLAPTERREIARVIGFYVVHGGGLR